MDEEFDLRGLCEHAEVTPRTVHFYVQQGLLPPASAPGPGARYGAGHLSRLRLIRLLQKQHLPLAEIAKRLKGISDEQAGALVAETQSRRDPPRESALEYIRSVLSDQGRGHVAAMSRDPGSPATAPPVSAGMRSASAAPSREAPPEPARSQWDRFVLADGIELSVRRPLTRLQQRQLSAMLAAARSLFGSDEEE